LAAPRSSPILGRVRRGGGGGGGKGLTFFGSDKSDLADGDAGLIAIVILEDDLEVFGDLGLEGKLHPAQASPLGQGNLGVERNVLSLRLVQDDPNAHQLGRGLVGAGHNPDRIYCLLNGQLHAHLCCDTRVCHPQGVTPTIQSTFRTMISKGRCILQDTNTTDCPQIKLFHLRSPVTKSTLYLDRRVLLKSHVLHSHIRSRRVEHGLDEVRRVMLLPIPSSEDALKLCDGLRDAKKI
jgi:hypothetical protein